jgi:hypothetical protein
MKLRTSSEVLNTLVDSFDCDAAVGDEAMSAVLPGHHSYVSRVLQTGDLNQSMPGYWRLVRPAYAEPVSRWIHSWLSGPRAALEPVEGTGEPRPHRWRGERLGLPESGPGAAAPIASRAAALAIDVVLAALIAGLFTAPELPRNWSLLPWFLITVSTVSFFGFTPGMLALGIRVVRMDGAAMIGPVRAIPRTVMVGVIIPAAIWDADGRGLHDKAVGTIVLRMR